MKSERRRGGLEGNQNSVKHNRYGKKMLRLEEQVRSMIREHRTLLDGLKQKEGEPWSRASQGEQQCPEARS